MPKNGTADPVRSQRRLVPLGSFGYFEGVRQSKERLLRILDHPWIQVTMTQGRTWMIAKSRKPDWGNSCLGRHQIYFVEPLRFDTKSNWAMFKTLIDNSFRDYTHTHILGLLLTNQLNVCIYLHMSNSSINSKMKININMNMNMTTNINFYIGSHVHYWSMEIFCLPSRALHEADMPGIPVGGRTREGPRWDGLSFIEISSCYCTICILCTYHVHIQYLYDVYYVYIYIYIYIEYMCTWYAMICHFEFLCLFIHLVCIRSRCETLSLFPIFLISLRFLELRMFAHVPNNKKIGLDFHIL